jgi:hypothetical protein
MTISFASATRRLTLPAGIPCYLLIALFTSAPAKPPSSSPHQQNSRSHRFILHNGVAFDQKTGLEWRRCTLGRMWQNVRCLGETRRFTWYEAVQYRDSDWRAPTSTELFSLWQEQPDPRLPNIDTEVFLDIIEDLKPCSLPISISHHEPAPISCSDFWTSSPTLSVDFLHRGGDIVWPNHTKDFRLYVLAGRTAQAPVTAEPHSPATSIEPAISRSGRFRLSGAEAEDLRTHLIWQRCPAGKTFSPRFGCVGVSHLHDWNEARRLQDNG